MIIFYRNYDFPFFIVFSDLEILSYYSGVCLAALSLALLSARSRP